MDENACGSIRDLLPDLLHRRLPGPEAERVGEHLESCGACREELEVLESLLKARPDPPGELAERIRASLRRDARRARTGGPWLIPLAAALVVALGVGTFWRGGANGPGPVVEDWTSVESVPSLWPSGDGLMAGAPLLDQLSEEALRSLLQELGG
jgi:hypothetical protein